MANGELLIVIWNVEHGSAIYVNTPNGRHIVMDAGASREFSPSLWLKNQYSVQQVDYFILSHADADHLDDIRNLVDLNPVVFSRNKSVPDEKIYPTFPPETDPLRFYRGFDAKYNTPITPGSWSDLRPVSNWGGLAITIVDNEWPMHKFEKLNDYSMATFLVYGDLWFLFPGDLEPPGWGALMRNSAFVDISTPDAMNSNEVRILVASHHGHESGVYREFLDLYRPHLTLMSDKYGETTTDYQTYARASSGYPVRDQATGTISTRKVVTTKTNNYIAIYARSSGVTVAV